jgi:plasmid rolling circle replication initiator protein Rep
MTLSDSGVEPSEGDNFYLSEVSPKDKPWDVHRRNADKVRKLYQDVGYDRYAERIDQCSRRLEFALKSSDVGEVALKLSMTHFCRCRHCPVCQWRRSLMWRARFFNVLPAILADNPSARFVFLTLTVRNCELEQLRETLAWMNEAWKRLSHRKAFPAIGWVKSVEVTRSLDGTAHPHFHAVLMVKPSYFTHGYLSQAKWTEIWQSCLRVDYTPVLDIKTVKLPKGATAGEVEHGLAVALLETLKYSIKEADLISDAEWLRQLTIQLHKTRSVAVGGIFKNYITEEEPEDLIHTDLDNEEPASEDDPKVWFGWREMVQRYTKSAD